MTEYLHISSTVPAATVMEGSKNGIQEARSPHLCVGSGSLGLIPGSSFTSSVTPGLSFSFWDGDDLLASSNGALELAQTEPLELCLVRTQH